MIDIYICEDNKKELSLFTQYIKDVVSIENMDMEVALSSPDPHAVLQTAALSQNIGLFFLDIDSTFPADISKQLLYKCGLRVHPISHFTFYAGCDIC